MGMGIGMGMGMGIGMGTMWKRIGMPVTSKRIRM